MFCSDHNNIVIVSIGFLLKFSYSGVALILCFAVSNSIIITYMKGKTLEMAKASNDIHYSCQYHNSINSVPYDDKLIFTLNSS